LSDPARALPQEVRHGLERLALPLEEGVHGLGFHERVRVRPYLIVAQHDRKGFRVIEVFHEAGDVAAEEFADEGPAVADDNLVGLLPVLADETDDAGLLLAVGLDRGLEFGNFGLGEAGTRVLWVRREDRRRERGDCWHGGSPLGLGWKPCQGINSVHPCGHA
jgi:hypothetical protein